MISIEEFATRGISAKADPTRSLACHFWPKEDAARLRGQPFLACLRRCKRVAAFGRVCSNSPSGERASGKPTVRSGAVKIVTAVTRGDTTAFQAFRYFSRDVLSENRVPRAQLRVRHRTMIDSRVYLLDQIAIGQISFDTLHQ